MNVRPAGVPIHCIHVNGDPGSKLIRGYVEYFGVMRVVMCLSNSYSGSVFSATYAIDPTTGEELNLSVDLNLTLTDIQKAYNNEKLDEKVVQKAIDAVIGPTLKKQHEEERDRVLKKAVQYAFSNCGAKEGEMITEEQRNRLTGLLWEELEPWFLSQIINERQHN